MSDRRDFVVVGAGLAGLTAALALARAGHSVAVFEKHSKLGGYAQYFGKDPTFDASTHLLGGCGSGGWMRSVLSRLGVWDRVEWLPQDPAYHAVFPGASYSAAADPERFRQELCALWPSEAAGIGRFFAAMSEMGGAFLAARGAPGAPPAPESRTLAEVAAGCVRSEEARAALCGLWLFGGLPPERLSAAHYAMLWHTFHHQGCAAPRGGIKTLTDALAAALEEAGGALETRSPVARILRRRGQVIGVRLQDGREIAAGAVISTASPADTFEDLLHAEGETPAGYPPLRTFAASVSALTAHLLVDGPLNPPARTTLVHATTDLQEAYAALQREDTQIPALVCTVLDHGDPDRAPAGKHLVSLYTLAPYSRGDNWNAPFTARRGPDYRLLPDYQAVREAMGDRLVAAAESLFPGLSGRVTARKIGTPLTLERYTHNTGGAAFGWANLPEQSGPNRPGPETPFRGLFLAGHWTFPGGTVAGAVLSGALAAEAAQRG
jgi:phytoene dehydrogenase-like protein